MRIPGFNNQDLTSIVCRGICTLKNKFDILKEVNERIEADEKDKLQGWFTSSSYDTSSITIPHEAIYQLSSSFFEGLPEFEVFLRKNQRERHTEIGKCLVSTLHALNSEKRRLEDHHWRHSSVKNNILYPIKNRKLFLDQPILKYRALVPYTNEALEYVSNSNWKEEEIKKVRETLEKTKKRYEKVLK